jgi:hypothetical protein
MVLARDEGNYHPFERKGRCTVHNTNTLYKSKFLENAYA